MLVFITGPMVVGATTWDRDAGHTFHSDLHVVPAWLVGVLKPYQAAQRDKPGCMPQCGCDMAQYSNTSQYYDIA